MVKRLYEGRAACLVGQTPWEAVPPWERHQAPAGRTKEDDEGEGKATKKSVIIKTQINICTVEDSTVQTHHSKARLYRSRESQRSSGLGKKTSKLTQSNYNNACLNE